MTKQYLDNHSISRHEAEQKLRAIFETEDVFVVGQGFNINFSVPLDTYIHEWQIEALREFNYRLTNFHPVVNQSGMNDHLHIWVKEVMEYE